MVSAPSPSTASPVGVPLGLHKPFPRADKCFLFTAISISTRWEFKSLKLQMTQRQNTLGSKRNTLRRGTSLSRFQLAGRGLASCLFS